MQFPLFKYQTYEEGSDAEEESVLDIFAPFRPEKHSQCGGEIAFPTSAMSECSLPTTRRYGGRIPVKWI